MNIQDHNYLKVTRAMRSPSSPPLSPVVDTEDIPKQPGLELSDKIICKICLLFLSFTRRKYDAGGIPEPLRLALPKVQAQPGCTCQ